jgi:hypothetical protein
VALEPIVQPSLTSSASLPLDLHPCGGIDRIVLQEFLDFLADPGVRQLFRMEKRLPDLLPLDPKLLQHHLPHEDRGKVPLLGHVEDRPPASPLGRESGNLAFDHVEASRRVSSDPVGVDDHQEIFVEVVLLRDPSNILDGSQRLVKTLVGRSIHREFPIGRLEVRENWLRQVFCRKSLPVWESGRGWPVPERSGPCAGLSFQSRQSIPIVRREIFGIGGVRRL